MVMTMKTLNIQDGTLGETKEIYPPSSRAEQVRSMTNEELADFVRMIHGNGIRGLHPDCSWLEWLEKKTEIWPKVE